MTNEPKYKALFTKLKSNLENGVWRENVAIPTEREISLGYSVSRSTVRKAIELMIEKGYLRSEQGSGTFIRPLSSRDNFRSLHSFSEDISSKGKLVNQSILEVSVITPSDYLRNQLELESKSIDVQKIRRLRFADSTPIGIHTVYLPIHKKSLVTESELIEKQSLYRVLEDKWGLKPMEAVESLSARLPSPSESQNLEIPMSEAVLMCSRVTYSSRLQPIEYVEMVYPSSRYDYIVRINRKSFQV
ncbi:GntR family transcriptional regulator [Vibrio artabrorum]|uniref:GntR family transcriptional regulator n=1 Tax=Vibrio artabrorum TaxID=446374 RepID=UPI00354D5C47